MKGRSQTMQPDATVARLTAMGLRQDYSNWLTGISISVLMVLMSLVCALGLYGLTFLVDWLFWPVVVTLVLAVLLMIASSFLIKADRAKQADTALTTIRGASQGLVSIAGRIAPIEGVGLRSPTFDVPCVYLEGQAYSTWTRRVVGRIKERRAGLVRDETGEVFVPGEVLKSVFAKFFGRLERDTLDARYWPPERGKPPKGPYKISETILPVDIPVGVVGGFLTIPATESYLQAQARYSEQPEPLPRTLQTSTDEADWRLYADAMIARAAPSGQTPMLNIMVHPKGFNSLRVTALDTNHKRSADHFDAFHGWLMTVPCVLVLAYLFDYTTPQETLDWIDSLWQSFQQWLAGFF